MNNKDKYNLERQKRWSMAERGEPKAIRAACGQLRRALELDCTYLRYDTVWFERFDPAGPDNGWVRGAADYVIAVDANAHKRYIYAEIKIKARQFLKTETGGITANGTHISKYGCKSFYLDHRPVYQNMCEFSQKAGIDPNGFMLIFISEDLKEIHVISLAEISALIETGHRGVPICEIKEGYGTDTEEGSASSYLLPVAATHAVSRENAAYFLQNASPELVLPECYYASNEWYYHSCRYCDYIVSRHVGDLLIFDDAESALATGRRLCKKCGELHR